MKQIEDYDEEDYEEDFKEDDIASDKDEEEKKLPQVVVALKPKQKDSAVAAGAVASIKKAES